MNLSLKENKNIFTVAYNRCDYDPKPHEDSDETLNDENEIPEIEHRNLEYLVLVLIMTRKLNI